MACQTSPSITIDAELDDWNQSPFLEKLTAPWKSNIGDNTIFDSKTADGHFFFFFKTIDTTMIMVPFEKELSVVEGDRVELFFSASRDLSEYYCLEINPLGNILDYQASYYRKFDRDWDFENIKIAAKVTGDGYIVEGSIAMKEFYGLGIGEEFYLGIFRADYTDRENVTWFSWIVPDSKEPDFHIPSAFGDFWLE